MTAYALRQVAYFLTALCIIWPSSSYAHERSISYSSWDIHDLKARVTLRLSRLDLSRLAVPGDVNLRIFSGTEECRVTRTPRSLETVDGRAAFEWEATCPRRDGLRIRSDLLFDLVPSHLHFARVTISDSLPIEKVLSDAEREWLLDESISGGSRSLSGTSFTGYLVLGIKHIATGYDHLAFLLALLLIQISFIEICKIITGFTVAHSITLALATLGYVRPQQIGIDALIGLSIALVAFENVWLRSGRRKILPWLISAALALLAFAANRGLGRLPAVTFLGLSLFTFCYFGLLRRAGRPEPLRWSVAFVFGLVHGFGFAQVLVEAQLADAQLAKALLGFNLGVETGQLAFVGLIWPLLFVLANPGRSRLRSLVLDCGSAAVCSLGIFWFVTRSFGR